MDLRNGVLPEERRALLKRTLEKGGLVRAIEAHSGISGLIGDRACYVVNGERREFNALWISSLTDSVAKGFPDEEIVTIDSRLDTVHQVLHVTSKPIMYDGDTGGFPEQLNYLIKRLEAEGVSAIVLEDKKYPKSNSLLTEAKHHLETPEAFCQKLRYAQESRRANDFMVIGRIESLIVGEPAESALERAEAYLEAGADGIMIHSKSQSPKEVLDFAERYNRLNFPNGRKPLMCVPTTYHGTYEDELNGAGFNIILYANHLLRAGFLAMQKVCGSILENGRAAEADGLCATIKDLLVPVGSLRTYNAEYKQP